MTAGAEAAAALAPVRDALLARARGRAGRLVEDAERDAAAVIEAARAEADRIVADARTAGRADGEAVAAAERSRVRGHAREVVLAARRRAYDELRRRVAAGTRDLCTGPRGPGTVRRLTATAERLLGPGAAVQEVPGGGVVARKDGTELDLSAGVLADRAVAALGAEVTRLWEPR
ncbi:hypothetical protein [Actinomadura formosensis]|uniref:hypothetical protein n=1 Tax=Actinomadura formosensis TaxID=60706 RepID=UPI00082B105B|nr:hypothetical protein [Actinomadura formosensis]